MSNTEETTLGDFFGMLAELGENVNRTQLEIEPEKLAKLTHEHMEKIEPKDSVTEPPHYKNLAIDTLELMSVNFSDEAYMGFLEGNVLKYVMRYKMKNGVQDLRKAQYYLDLLINRQEMREENQNK